jgi:hypothetical protein
MNVLPLLWSKQFDPDSDFFARKSAGSVGYCDIKSLSVLNRRIGNEMQIDKQTHSPGEPLTIENSK